MPDDRRLAQDWHDANHGDDERENGSCWCCCHLCDPDWNPSRPNPYYDAAARS